MITTIDFAILDFIQTHWRTEIGDKIFSWITFLGDYGILWILLAVVLLCFSKTRKTGLTLGLALVIGFFVGMIGIKNLIRRERPFTVPDALLSFETLLIHTGLDRFSFPSAHTIIAFASAVVLFRFNKLWGIITLILAGLIGFSRLYLYVHFPSDVFVGMLVGIAAALLAQWIMDCITAKKQALPDA